MEPKNGALSPNDDFNNQPISNNSLSSTTLFPSSAKISVEHQAEPLKKKFKCLCFLLVGIVVTVLLLVVFTVAVVMYQTQHVMQPEKIEITDTEYSSQDYDSSFYSSWLSSNKTFPGQHTRTVLKIRLVDNGQINTRQGRVEIKYSNNNRRAKWGTVCDNPWSDNEAKVICRMLGYSDTGLVAKAYGSAHFGEGSGKIWLDDVICIGDEADIDSCSHTRWGRSNDCYHSDDAGVSCSIDGDECNPDPCLNGGQCQDGVSDYTCTCPQGYLGDTCELGPDSTAPSITCPANQPEAGDSAFTAPTGQTTVVYFDFIAATATDTYDSSGPAPSPTVTYTIGSPRPTQTDVTGALGTFAIGTTVVTATATDAFGNTDTCTFSVTVVEGTASPGPWTESGDYASQWAALNGICGRTSDNTRIFNGDDVTDISVWPWVAFLTTKANRGQGIDDLICTAVLISARWAITAAHCVQRNGRRRAITLGEGSPNRHQSNVVTFRHPGYNSRTLDNDIALLKLEDAVTFDSNYIKPICPTIGTLDHEETTYRVSDSAKQRCYVIGWGMTETYDYPSILQEVKSPLILTEACRNSPYGYTTNDITDNMICTSTSWSDVETGSCYGDSGGPMMCRNPAGYWDLVGVTSWGGGGRCGDPDYPDVLTRVSKNKDWIEITINAEDGP